MSFNYNLCCAQLSISSLEYRPVDCLELLTMDENEEGNKKDSSETV
jgi:hypothetical protein